MLYIKTFPKLFIYATELLIKLHLYMKDERIENPISNKQYHFKAHPNISQSSIWH